MELESYLVLLALFLISVLWVAKRNLQSWSSTVKLPPGPWKLPVIGNLHQLAMGGPYPYRVMRKLALKHGPLMHLQLGEISTVVVSSREMAKEVLKTHEIHFAQRPQVLLTKILGYGPADIGFSRYGDYWRQMRKICTLELLSSKTVPSFSFIRQDEVSKVIETIRESAGSPLNVSALMAPLVSFIICRAAFGSKAEGDELMPLIKEVAIFAGVYLEDVFPSLKPLHLFSRMEAKLRKFHKRLDKALSKIINDHRGKMMMKSKAESEPEPEKQNLVDVLLRLQQTGDLPIPITDNCIKPIIMEMFAAGTDPPASTIEWAISEMMRNPRVREKAQAEIREAFRGKKIIHESELEQLSYIKLVIKETMRLHPPAPLLIPRECREACKIGGYDIPEKTMLLVGAWALGRDPEYWHDAESFIPERFHENSVDFKGTNFEFIPFGAGRRMCPGMSFGLASIEIILVSLLYHFDWQLPHNMKPEDLDMSEAFGVNIHRKNNLFLIPTPYNP